MPLPEPTAPREPMHTRAVRIEAFRRADGCWDLEAELADTKPFDTPLHSGVRPAGEPIHLMRLRLTIDESFNIVDAVAVSDSVPYPGHCDPIAPGYRRMIGLNLQHGFRQGLRERLGGVAGCTHLTELGQFLPTAAFQAFAGDPRFRQASASGTEKPFQLDRCHALRSDGPAVALYYPQWHRPAQAGSVPAEETQVSMGEHS